MNRAGRRGIEPGATLSHISGDERSLYASTSVCNMSAMTHPAVDDAGDFPGLSLEERQFIELKLALAAAVRRRREHLSLNQLQGRGATRVEPVASGADGGRHWSHDCRLADYRAV